jgi:hypothetical protein
MTASHAIGERSMWVVYLEMGLALALAVFIIWWTRPRKDRGKDERRDDDQ